MKLDFGSLAFGYTVRAGGNTPNWATSLGQSRAKNYRINDDASINEILKGMTYCAVPVTSVSTKIGKGGAEVSGKQDGNPIVSAAVFKNVYINETPIYNSKFVLLITRDTSQSHFGRLRFKYGPSNKCTTEDGTYSNETFFAKAREQLGLAEDACFFVSEINVVNQSDLILKTFIVNKYHSVEYADGAALRAAWEDLADFNIELPEEDNSSMHQGKDIVAANIPEDLTVQELGQILAAMYNAGKNKTAGIHMFGVKYGAIIAKNGYSANSLVTASGINASYDTEVSKGLRLYESLLSNEYGVKFFDGDHEEPTAEKEAFVLPALAARTRKRYPLNCILYGAPGTGKTYATAQYALAIAEDKELAMVRAESRSDIMARYNALVKAGQIVFTTFHQNYGYEDFIQGIRPDTSSEEMKFKTVDGVFKVIAQNAMKAPEKDFVIIIDEINRANISKVFGELITLIEDDKRWGEDNAISVTLPSGEVFAVPNNLYIVGTMNSADKSISLIDAALRRRFEFVEFVPELKLVSNETLRNVLKVLNEGIESQLNSSDLLVGHSYFIGKSEKDLADIMNRSIIPLLYEYFFDDKKKVEAQLKKALDGLGYDVVSASMGRLKVIKKAGQ